MTITPEELLHMVNGVMTATARAVSACNSQNQDELVTAAALGKKMVDLLRGCKVTSYCRQCNLICGCEPDGRVWVWCGCGMGVGMACT